MNKNELGYHRVMAGVAKYDNYSKMVSGTIIHNPHFVEHITEATLMFREMFEDRIVEKIGDTGWAVWFIQNDQLTVSYLVDIYTDELDNFPIIVSVINKWVHPDFKFIYYRRGTVADFLR